MKELLQFMNAFIDGRGYAGLVEAVEVPKIEVVSREFSAAGMAGPVKVRTGRIAAMESSLTFKGFPADLYKLIRAAEGDLIALTIKGSTQDSDGTTHAHTIQMRGFIEKLDEGEWKDGEDVPLKLDLSLRYYKRLRDGVELIEADPENMILRVNGRDQLAQHRANIGR